MGLIQNVVVVMLENRSYDNVLGWLYNANNAAPYNKAPSGQADLQGLTGDESNPNPFGGTQTVLNQPTQTIAGGGQVWPGTTIPMIDPGEKFSDMAQQFLNVVPGKDPYSNNTPNMQGFMNNYQSKVSEANIQDVMNYLTPAQLPVTAYLANQFAVCDEWFASVPTQTFTNRLFAFCAAPAIVHLPFHVYSIVDDDQYEFDPLTYRPLSTMIDLPTICKQLDDKFGESTTNWKVYFHDYSIAVLTIPYIANAASAERNLNVSTFDNLDWGTTTPKQVSNLPWTFVEDLQNKSLPPYSFIEPRYSRTFAPNPLPPECNHPGPGDFGLIVKSDPSDPPIDATGGELLLMQVYNLLRQSDYWSSTLLIVTYDEHGGVFDHYPPPAATPPGTVNLDSPPPLPEIPLVASFTDPPASGFDYTIYGGRVPAIIVSPLAGPGTTIRSDGTPFDHASIVRTVWDVFDLSTSDVTSLTKRDANAPAVTDFLNATADNNPPVFSGTIVASPSALVFDGLLQMNLLASAGPGFTLTVSYGGVSPWMSFIVSDATAGTDTILVGVSILTNGLQPGTYTSSLVISGDGVASVTVPVTLYFN